MRAESWKRQTIELDGSPVYLTSYEIADRYLAEVEAVSSGTTIARAAEVLRNEAESQALEKALSRLRSARYADPGRTVGG